MTKPMTSAKLMAFCEGVADEADAAAGRARAAEAFAEALATAYKEAALSDWCATRDRLRAAFLGAYQQRVRELARARLDGLSLEWDDMGDELIDPDAEPRPAVAGLVISIARLVRGTDAVAEVEEEIDAQISALSEAEVAGLQHAARRIVARLPAPRRPTSRTSAGRAPAKVSIRRAAAS